MARPSGGKSAATDRAKPDSSESAATDAWRAAAIAWVLPGAAHFLRGDVRRGAVFLVVLLGMFGIGLGFGGRLFPLQMAEPLVFLAGLAEWAMLAPRLMAAMTGAGAGSVTAATYEYGNTFLIVAGLLNVLVMLDAADRARGRKGA